MGVSAARTHRGAGGNENSVLSHAQFGFCRGRSAEEAIFTLVNGLNINRHVHARTSHVGFVDQREACDAVTRGALLFNLA